MDVKDTVPVDVVMSTSCEDSVIKSTQSLTVDEDPACVSRPSVSSDVAEVSSSCFVQSVSDLSPSDGGNSSSASSWSSAAVAGSGSSAVKSSSGAKKTSSLDGGDSAYMSAHPASTASTPSSLSPVSWTHDWRDQRVDDDDDNDHKGKQTAGQTSQHTYTCLINPLVHDLFHDLPSISRCPIFGDAMFFRSLFSFLIKSLMMVMMMMMYCIQ